MSEKEFGVHETKLWKPTAEDPQGVPSGPVMEEYDCVKLTKRVEELEYAVSALTLAASQKEESSDTPEGDKDVLEKIWRSVYRMHNPEIKGAGMSVTTSETRDGHVYERGYSIEIWDNDFDPPEIRIRKK